MNEINTYEVVRLPIREQKTVGAQIRLVASGKKFVRKELVTVIFEILEKKWNPITKQLDTNKYFVVRTTDGSEIVTDAAGKTALV